MKKLHRNKKGVLLLNFFGNLFHDGLLKRCIMSLIILTGSSASYAEDIHPVSEDLEFAQRWRGPDPGIDAGPLCLGHAM